MGVNELYKRIEEIDKELELEYEDGDTDWAANLEAEKERIEEIICILEKIEYEKRKMECCGYGKSDLMYLIGLEEELTRLEKELDEV